MQKTPRQLAKAFFRGELGWSEYRVMRRHAIDSLTGNATSAVGEGEGGQSSTVGDTVPRFRARSSSGKLAVKSSFPLRLLLVSVVVLIVLLLLVRYTD
jgi:hypothetical protein